ncbi:DUF3048 domain-containing protein [Lutibacter sp. B2]|nr:DUF3048 domain-containing protein [Lutibacter sp. B2]
MFKKCNLAILIIIGGILFLGGCAKEEKEMPTSVEQEPQVVIDKSENEIEKEEIIVSPISGIDSDQETIQKRPFAVMFDNQVKARPQAGLDQAEIIYEMLAEGNITRYMAIFLTGEPKLIGPVRSARPYFINKAMEYDALYIHDGGSPQALEDIVNFKIADISAQSRDQSIFWRKSHKSRPHNEYTSTNAIRKAAMQSRYREQVTFDTLKFNKKDQSIGGDQLGKIVIPYSKDYKVSFVYDEDAMVFYRYINDQKHLDEESKKHLSAKNIMIQKVSTTVIDNEGRIEIQLVGKGQGLYITNGQMKEVVWEKTSRRGITKFFYENGEEIDLNPGVTWMEVIPTNFECSIQ